LDCARIRHAVRSQTHNPDALRSKFRGKPPSEPFNGAHGRGEAPQQWNSGARGKPIGPIGPADVPRLIELTPIGFRFLRLSKSKPSN